MFDDYEAYVNEEVRSMNGPTDFDEHVMNEYDCADDDFEWA